MEINFINKQNLQHKIELFDHDIYFHVKIFVKFFDDFELYSEQKVRKTIIERFLKNCRNLEHQLEKHITIDFLSKDPKIDFNGKIIGAEDLPFKSYDEIKEWIPDLNIIPFYIHKVENGICFSTNDNNIKKLLNVLKDKFSHNVFNIYLL